MEILKSELPKEEGVFEYYLDLYRKLNNTVPDLIEQKVITDFSQIKKTKDSAWNYGRGAFLSRCCYELGYFSEKELKEYLEKSYKGIKTIAVPGKNTQPVMFSEEQFGVVQTTMG